MNRYSIEDNEKLGLDTESILPRSPSTYSIDYPSSEKDLGVRGPRSKVVEAILLLLYAKPMRCSEIARVLGKPTKLVSSYLSYWKSRGYVFYRSGYWVLTKQGEEHVKMFIESLGIAIATPHDVVLLAHKLINEQVQQTINSWVQPRSTPYETEIQQFSVKHTSSKVGKQKHGKDLRPTTLQKALDCVTKVLESKDLLEDEMHILNHLIKHYIEWGSTYLYLDQIAEELHYQVHELTSILRKLQSKRLLYLYTDKRFGVRVGLGKSFKQILDQCISKQ